MDHSNPLAMFDAWKQERAKKAEEQDVDQGLIAAKKEWLEPFEVPVLDTDTREFWRFFAHQALVPECAYEFLASPITASKCLDGLLGDKRYTGVFKAVVLPGWDYPKNRCPSPLGVARDLRARYPGCRYNILAFLFWLLRHAPSGLWHHVPDSDPDCPGRISLPQPVESPVAWGRFWIPTFYVWGRDPKGLEPGFAAHREYPAHDLELEVAGPMEASVHSAKFVAFERV